MSLKDNPLFTDEPVEQSHRNDTAYGTVTPLVEEDDIKHTKDKVAQYGKYIIDSLWTGIKVAGFVLGLLTIMFLAIAIPVGTVHSYINGMYYFAIPGTIIILIVMGMVYDEIEK